MIEKPSEENKHKFQKTRTKCKKMYKEKKKKSLENRIKDMEEKYQNKEIRNFYKEAKSLRQNTYQKTQYIRGKEGDLVGGTAEKLKRWKEYFSGLLNDEGNVNQSHEIGANRNRIENDEISEEDIPTLTDVKKGNSSYEEL